MASLIPALLKAVQAQDDEFVRSILDSDVFTDADISVAVKEMPDDDCTRFFDVLVSLILREPINNKARRWLAAVEERGVKCEGITREALATVLEYEASLQARLRAVHELVSTVLDRAVTAVQRDAFRVAREELARSTQSSEPLLKYTVKH